MKHFVFGYTHPTRKGAVTVLYAGDSRAEAIAALQQGAAGIARTDYVCNPQIARSKRFRTEEGLPSARVEPPAAEVGRAPSSAKVEKPGKLVLPAKSPE